ncbi:MAG: IS21-like element helper ATPase IstB [Bryobacteraceae bacterium]
MLLEQTIDKLYTMKLDGMAAAIREQTTDPAALSLSFEERLGLVVDRQWDLKESRGLRRRLQVARLRQPSAIEDIDFHSARGLDKSSLLSLAECKFIESRCNIIITGPTGAGKTYVACALAHKACRLKHSVRYFGCGSLVSALAIARADGSYNSLLRRLEKTDLLVIDDWGMYPLDAEAARDVFEILESRTNRGSVIVVSQVPVDAWYDIIPAPTIADAILDRLVHNAYRIEMKGDSMRKKLSPLTNDGG